MAELPDVDIDLGDRDRAAGLFPKAVVASQVNQKKMTPHKNGIYFQRIPVDKATGLAAYPYKEAEDRGYFKVDLLHNRVYDTITTEEELDAILAEPIDWDWFLDDRFFDQENPDHRIFHLGLRWGFLCRKYPPRSIQDLAALMNLKTPAKAYLYKENATWSEIEARIWQKESNGEYGFKKSHSVAYAIVATLDAKRIAKDLGIC